MSAPPGRFAGLVAVITGGNSGIGRGIAHRFASERAKTAIVGRDANKGRAVAAELNERDARAEFSAADLADEQAVESLIDAVTERFARIDVLVNCAGVGSRRAGVEDDDGPGRRWDKLRGPNLDSTYFMCAYAMPALTPSGGAIVNISSTATWHGNWGLYGVAKAGVEALTRSFAVEGAPRGVRVNCVSPGWIRTEQDATLDSSGTEDGEWEMPPSLLERMGTPDEIATAVAYLASTEASFITGQTLIVDGGLAITDYPSRSLLAQVGERLHSRRRDNPENSIER